MCARWLRAVLSYFYICFLLPLFLILGDGDIIHTLCFLLPFRILERHNTGMFRFQKFIIGSSNISYTFPRSEPFRFEVIIFDLHPDFDKTAAYNQCSLHSVPDVASASVGPRQILQFPDTSYIQQAYTIRHLERCLLENEETTHGHRRMSRIITFVVP